MHVKPLMRWTRMSHESLADAMLLAKATAFETVLCEHHYPMIHQFLYRLQKLNACSRLWGRMTGELKALACPLQAENFLRLVELVEPHPAAPCPLPAGTVWLTSAGDLAAVMAVRRSTALSDLHKAQQPMRQAGTRHGSRHGLNEN